MPTYTVTAVSDQVRDWNSAKGGAMKEYRVTLRNGEGRELANVEWSRKATSPKPEINQSIDCTIDYRYGTTHGPKLTLTQGQSYGGGGGRAKPPEERRSIAMQHAQKCAVSILEVAASHGSYKPPEKVADMAFHVEAVAASLFKQVLTAEGGQS